MPKQRFLCGDFHAALQVMERTHTRARKQHEEEYVCERNCSRLTTTLISHPLHPLYLHPLVVHLPQISLLLLYTVPWKLMLLQALNNSSFNCLYPQTTLCNTALDNPTQRNKTQLIRAAVKFLETDTVWYEMGTQLDFGKRAGESEGKHLLSPSHGTALICAGFCPRV